MQSLLHSLRRGRGLSTYAAFVVAFMVLVILQGAVVRATGSGNGCGNHWPLCNGDFFPHHPRLATLIEYAHRSMSGIVTWLVIALVGWTYLARPTGHRARHAATWTGILLVTEALLGAVLVKFGLVEQNTSMLRVIIQGIHFSNTLLLLAAMTLAWWWLRPQPVTLLTGRTRTVAWIALFSTLLTGATGAVAALADTLFPSPTLGAGLAADFAANAPLLIRMRWLHPAAALIALGCAIWLSLHLRSTTLDCHPERRPKAAVEGPASRIPGTTASHWLLALILLQLLLGIGDVLLLAPTWMQVLHLLGADLYWIALTAACSGVFLRSAPRP